MRYLALVRGINVGGRNIIRMPDLRRVFESLGLKDVTTYIQSGNVLFDGDPGNAAVLTFSIERALTAEFGSAFPVVLLTGRQLESVIKKAPPEFGDDPVRYRYDVVFVKPPFRAELILPTISVKEGVDEVLQGNGVLYLRRLTIRATQSHLPKLTRHTAYGNMTIRNWKTTTELRRLMTAAEKAR